MADDSPFPTSKRGTNPRSLGNLRPPVKGEPSRNQAGNNGRTRAETIASFLEEVDDTAIGKQLLAKIGCPNATRIRGLLHREWLAGMGKSDLARKTLIEQYAGRPKQQVDLTSSDRSMSPNRKPTTAEARQELDRILEELDNPAAGDEPAQSIETQQPAEGGAAPDSEPKATP
jgi:hypothetical protein